MTHDDIAIIAVRTVDTLVVTENILIAILGSMSCVSMQPSIAAENLHFQFSWDYLAIIAIAKALEARSQRIAIKFSAFCSPPIDLCLARVLSCINFWRRETGCMMPKKGMET